MFPSQLALALAISMFDTSPKTDAPAPGAAKIQAGKVEEIAADISGYYVCKGKEAAGKEYSGVCVIAKKNDVYLVSWMIGTGSTFSGIGIRQGNTLAVSWALPSDRGTVRGVNLYTVQAGGKALGDIAWTRRHADREPQLFEEAGRG